MPEPAHLAAPFTITKAGAKINEQGTPADVLASAVNVCQCPEGFREDLPQFGRPEFLFNTIPLPLSDLTDAIVTWEPDANQTVVEEAVGRVQGERDIGVEVA